jgi:hypothetical protein
MANEFDDFAGASPPVAATHTAPAQVRSGTPVSRLVARLFTAAGNPLRARMLRILMRPLGLLGAAGVASGAFLAFLDRQGGGELRIDHEAVARVSSQQMIELAHFVEQVDPQALQQFAGQAASSPLAMATFSASVLMLLHRRLQAAASRPAAAAAEPRPGSLATPASDS